MIFLNGGFMKHTKAYRRHMNKQKLNHKLSIIKDSFDKDYYEFLTQHPRRLGQLVKGKVHCSCPMCSEKSKNRGLPIRDQRKKGFVKGE